MGQVIKVDETGVLGVHQSNSDDYTMLNSTQNSTPDGGGGGVRFNLLPELVPGLSPEASLKKAPKEIPVFGYNMTIKMACLVLEEYRDFSYPLTKYGRDVLLGYSKTIDVTMANAPYIDESSYYNNDSSSSSGGNGSGNIGNGKSFDYLPTASISSSSSSSKRQQQQKQRRPSSAGYQEEVMKNRPVGATSVCYICAGK